MNKIKTIFDILDKKNKCKKAIDFDSYLCADGDWDGTISDSNDFDNVIAISESDKYAVSSRILGKYRYYIAFNDDDCHLYDISIYRKKIEGDC